MKLTCHDPIGPAKISQFYDNMAAGKQTGNDFQSNSWPGWISEKMEKKVHLTWKGNEFPLANVNSMDYMYCIHTNCVIYIIVNGLMNMD